MRDPCSIADQFSGNTWEISVLPVAMGNESLQDFLGAWFKVPSFLVEPWMNRVQL